MREKTPRIKALREKLVAADPIICPERALFWTQSYKETESEPAVIRAALALKKTLEGMTIFVYESELLVGNQGSSLRAAPLHPQINLWFMDELDQFELRDGSKFRISTDTKEKLKQTMGYWRGKTVFERTMALLPQAALDYSDSLVFTCNYTLTKGTGHFLIGFDEVLKKGYLGIKTECEQYLSTLDLSSPEDFDKIPFYKAMIIVCDACIAFAHRYAALARQQAEACEDDVRKAELIQISENCERVPAYPAGSFYEALQSTWLMQVIAQIESDGTGLSLGRCDYIWYPYYRTDIESGAITQAFAEELLDSFWLKCGEVIEVWNEEDSKFFGGHPISQTITLGGMFADGSDATNDLSYLCLDTTARIAMPQPSVCVRISKGTPKAFMQRCVEVARIGLGMPAFYNDEVAIPSLMARGVKEEHARENFGVAGCVEMGLQGQMCHFANSGYFSLLKALEVTLNDGFDPRRKKQVGPHTGAAESFKTYDDLLNAYKTQIAAALKQMVGTTNAVNTMHGRHLTLPFISSFTQNCIVRGKEVHDGGALYNHDGTQAVGLADATDSLAAIKKLVFEEGSLSMRELTVALAADFEEHMETRVKLFKDAPKYGNNERYVDDIARDLAAFFCEEVGQYSNVRGGVFVPGLYSVSANVPIGVPIGATPNGRKAGAPVAEACSPSHGAEKSGPTQSCMSVAHLDHVLATNGTQYNQKYHPSSLAGEKGISALIDLVETFYENGGYHIQFNVVSEDMLRKAQKSPEKYRDLVIRVAGYTAFFIDLNKDTQEDIIERTQLTL